MAGEIQARMPGLINYLSLETEGRLPSQLAAAVQGAVDLTPFVNAASRERLNTFSSGIVARGGLVFAGTTVQPREYWLVIAYAIESSNVTAGPLGFSPTFFRPASFGGGSQHETCGPSFLYTGTAGVLGSSFCSEPRLLMPGTQLGAIVHLLPGAAFDLFATIDFVRIRI
jgi:hypothetical protein